MKISAGLVLLKNNKILLGHPARASWQLPLFSIPKGEVEPDENYLLAAIRETAEEVGIKVPSGLISTRKYVAEYKNNAGKLYKKVFYFVVKVDSLNLPDVLPKEQLQANEIDHAAFYTKEEAKKILLPKQLSILNSF